MTLGEYVNLLNASLGSEYKANYFVVGYDHYEPDEITAEFTTLKEAVLFAGRIIDDGGYAEISDKDGDTYDVDPWWEDFDNKSISEEDIPF